MRMCVCESTVERLSARGPALVFGQWLRSQVCASERSRIIDNQHMTQGRQEHSFIFFGALRTGSIRSHTALASTDIAPLVLIGALHLHCQCQCVPVQTRVCLHMFGETLLLHEQFIKFEGPGLVSTVNQCLAPLSRRHTDTRPAAAPTLPLAA